MRCVTITVSGKVQGVWFRKYTYDKAIELSLSGTVQNLANGNVLIHASGDSALLSAFEEWCWQGSPLSNVKNVEVSETGSLTPEGFQVLE
ncbi:MAG: acylphosphatase [Flavobacteriales bacterium]|nr:acylphosphatase [Flavobacteriales bacterium]